jgi:hypothetical protein
MVVSMTQLATYDHAKHLLDEKLGVQGVKLHLSASLVSGKQHYSN